MSDGCDPRQYMSQAEKKAWNARRGCKSGNCPPRNPKNFSKVIGRRMASDEMQVEILDEIELGRFNCGGDCEVQRHGTAEVIDGSLKGRNLQCYVKGFEPLREVLLVATALVEQVCGLHFLWTQNARRADLMFTMADLDGESGTLGKATVPQHTNVTRTQIAWFDKEDWNRLGYMGQRRVVQHELLHMLGLGHIDGVKSIMNPMYRTDIDVYQPPEIELLQTSYGKPY